MTNKTNKTNPVQTTIKLPSESRSTDTPSARIKPNSNIVHNTSTGK